MSEVRSFELKACPIPHTHQRLRQAHILWHQASENYQNVDLFLTNVNSLIQELRNITFILQSEKSTFSDFDAWYTPWQEGLKKDKHGKWLVETRNLVVKQGALATASRFNVTFLTYESIEVACLFTDNDLSVLSLLKRSDFISIVARLRIAMRDEGDAVLAIERCWSTPELAGVELLEVLGRLYGILAIMVLHAHVHLGSLECIPASQHDSSQDSEFPERQGRSYLLPCMMRAQAARTDFFSLKTFAKLSGGRVSISRTISPDDVAWRYGFTTADAPKSFDSIDPSKIFEKVVENSKRMLRKDRSLGRQIMLRDGRGNWSGHLIMTRDRLDKYLMAHLLAQTVREEGCDAVIEIAETWIFDRMPPMSQLDNAHRIADRKEAISVVLATRDGLRRHAITQFTRGPLGSFRFLDTTEIPEKGLNYLKPIYWVWYTQNQFEKAKGYTIPTWHPDLLSDCLCGSSRPFGVCCVPVLDGPEAPIRNSDDLLRQGNLQDAERHARAGVTQYAIWIRQHTAMLLNVSVHEDDEKLISIDCLALEDYLSRLERWALSAGEVDAVSSTCRRLEDTLGVPAIVRRVVALGARWLMKNGRIEEGILELDRLGPASELNDTLALSLSAEYGDQGPEEKIRILESAVNFALDSHERSSARLRLAAYLSEQGSRQSALDLIAVVLEEADYPATILSATVLRWQVSRSEDDFQSLFHLMDAEESENSRLSGASFLFDHEKPEAALDLLKSLLDRNHPVACLLAAEGHIQKGDCVAAKRRLSSVKLSDSSPVEVRLGFAHLQALLVLECGETDMRQAALEQLMELKKFKPSPHIDQLIAALEASE